MADESDGSGLKEGMRTSPSGDPRLLFALNVAFSLVYVYIVFYLAELVDIVTFSWERYLIGTLLVVVLVHYVTR